MASEYEIMSVEDVNRFKLALGRCGFQTPGGLTGELMQVLANERLDGISPQTESVVAFMRIQKPRKGLLAFAVDMVINKEEASLFWIGQTDASGNWNFLVDDALLYITNRRLILFFKNKPAAPKPDRAWTIELIDLKTARYDNDILVLGWYHIDHDLRLGISFPQASPTQILAGLEPFDANLTDRYRSVQARNRVDRLNARKDSAKQTLFEFFAAVVQINQFARSSRAGKKSEQLSVETIELLDKLAQLKAAGLLSEEEYGKKVQDLLARA